MVIISDAPTIKEPQLAKRRTLCLKRKFSRDAKFHEDYVTFLEELISESYAGKVPPDVVERSDDKVSGFIPHHGVYRHQKPDKFRVVFDCLAQFQGTSLNNKFFQGPDITNNLVIVLIHFRQETVAVMGDVKSLLHQVRVSESDGDLLLFLRLPHSKVTTCSIK